MSLFKSKMGAAKGSLKEQLIQEEKDLAAELEAVHKAKVHVAKKDEPVKKAN